ncbi:MAG TPA: glycerophosphodiester phosphodiesterase family protein [Allosphingosinicella sp.]|jgi:glycerophosphoryl diester phosphodiesterase
MRLSPSRLLDGFFAPPPVAERIDWLTAQPFAHRGLHGADIVENCRAAFEAAVAAGHGIELDVQASRDGEAIVFHDYDLERLTGQPGRVRDRTAAELQEIAVRGSGERIPTLLDIVHLIDSRVPMLIEVKAPSRRVAALCASVLRAVRDYRGYMAVMSFNPEVGRWFWNNGRGISRGLVVTERNRGRVHGGAERRLSLWRARPHFLAYDIEALPSAFAREQRRRGLPVLTWTVRGVEQRQRAAAYADQIIYEAA